MSWQRASSCLAYGKSAWSYSFRADMQIWSSCDFKARKSFVASSAWATEGSFCLELVGDGFLVRGLGSYIKGCRSNCSCSFF